MTPVFDAFSTGFSKGRFLAQEYLLSTAAAAEQKELIELLQAPIVFGNERVQP